VVKQVSLGACPEVIDTLCSAALSGPDERRGQGNGGQLLRASSRSCGVHGQVEGVIDRCSDVANDGEPLGRKSTVIHYVSGGKNGRGFEPGKAWITQVVREEFGALGISKADTQIPAKFLEPHLDLALVETHPRVAVPQIHFCAGYGPEDAQGWLPCKVCDEEAPCAPSELGKFLRRTLRSMPVGVQRIN
jgi:hypothetical protein